MSVNNGAALFQGERENRFVGIPWNRSRQPVVQSVALRAVRTKRNQARPESAINDRLQTGGVARPPKRREGCYGEVVALAWQVPKSWQPIELELGSNLQATNELIKDASLLAASEPAKPLADIDPGPFFGW